MLTNARKKEKLCWGGLSEFFLVWLQIDKISLLPVWVHVNTCAQRITCTYFFSQENCKLSLIWTPSPFILIWMKNNLWGHTMALIRQNFDNSLTVCYQTSGEVWRGAGLGSKSSLGYDAVPFCSLGKVSPLFSSSPSHEHLDCAWFSVWFCFFYKQGAEKWVRSCKCN